MLHLRLAAFASAPDPLVSLPLAHHNQPAPGFRRRITCRATARWRLGPGCTTAPAARRCAYAS
jgi:hypothetical protein